MTHCRTSDWRRMLLTGGSALALSVCTANGLSAQESDISQLADSGNVDVLVVTGSRIARTELNSVSPTTTVTADEIRLSGEQDLGNLLSQIGSLTTSITADRLFTDDIADNQGSRTAPGLSVLNLRGLGTNRTLVLEDGRRHVGARAGDTAVDINTIPAALIERVDVVTGGASAVYGSDAVTGVVNFVLKDDFEGFAANAQGGISQEGDGQRYRISVTAGGNFADDRGNATVSLDYRRQDGIEFRDRDFLVGNGLAFRTDNPALRYQAGDDIPSGFAIGDPNGADGAPFVYARDRRFAISSPFGLIVPDINGDGFGDVPAFGLFDTDVNNNGVGDMQETFVGSGFNGLAPFGFGSVVVDATGAPRLIEQGKVTSLFQAIGGEGTAFRQDALSAVPEQDFVVVNGRFRYDLFESVRFFANGKFVSSQTETFNSDNGFDDFLPVSLENPYLPDELRVAMEDYQALFPGAFDDGQYLIGRDHQDLGDTGTDNERTTLRIVTGFEGNLTDSIDYEISFNYGRTEDKQIRKNRRILDRFYAAADVVTDPSTGQPVCRSELDPSATPPLSDSATTPGGFLTFQPGQGLCKPLNLFGIGNSSQEALDFVTTDDVRNDVLEQTVFLAYISGDSSEFFELPAGPVGFAFGTEYRREDSQSDISEFAEARLIDVGGRSTGGSYNVWEVFAEASVPLLDGAPFAETLSVDAAVRLADYNTIGSATTWKIGGVWAPTDDIRFRAGFSEAVRAPNILELFSPEQDAFFAVGDIVDPCDNANINDNANRAANCAADPNVPAGFNDTRITPFQGLTGGNPDLEEETAETFTAGVVVTPRVAPGFSLTVDYYGIKIDNAVGVLPAQELINRCYDSASIDNQFCNLVGRDATTGNLNFLRQSAVNISELTTEGVDFAARYDFSLDDIGLTGLGDLGVFVVGTRVLALEQVPDAETPDVVDDELGELFRPEWTVTTNLAWSLNEALTINYEARWIDSMLVGNIENEEADQFVDAETGDTWIHDISASFALTDEMDLYGGVLNITNEEPFRSNVGYPVSPLGRYFFLGVNVQF